MPGCAAAPGSGTAVGAVYVYQNQVALTSLNLIFRVRLMLAGNGASAAALAIVYSVWWVGWCDVMFGIYLGLMFLDFLMRMCHARNLKHVAPKDNEFAVVTGASGGIGREIAMELASRGYNIAMVARSEGKLSNLAKEVESLGRRARVYKTDLSNADQLSGLIAKISNDKLKVSLLINNAGVAYKSLFTEMDEKTMCNMISLNIQATIMLTRAILPHMVASGYGRVLIVSSIVGAASQPTQSIYAATKAFLSNFCGSLNYELRNTGVQVTCLEPGATLTGFAKRSAITDSFIFKVPTLQSTAQDVAKAGVDSMLSGSPRVTIGWFSHLAKFAGWLFPERITAWISTLFWANPHEMRRLLW